MYGTETEIFVHSFQKSGKTQNLIAEKEGRNTIDNPLRQTEQQNSWTLLGGSVYVRTNYAHSAVSCE